MGTTQAKAAAADAKAATTEREKTPSEITAETNELLNSLKARAAGPTPAQLARQDRLEKLAGTIATAAVQVAALCDGVPESSKVLAALKSIETAKHRATAAINSISDAAILGEDEPAAAPEATADDEEAGL